MSTYFEGIWDRLGAMGKVTRPKVNDGYARFRFDVDHTRAAAACPAGAAMRHMWTAETITANRKRWDWHGDTQVTVYQFKASSMEEAIVTAIVGYAFGAGGGCFATPQDSFLAKGPGGGGDVDRSWPAFWLRAVQGGNDLPGWPGAPRATVVLDQSGNRSLNLAQKDDTSYVLVHYTTS